jgi:hypothetical protein
VYWFVPAYTSGNLTGSTVFTAVGYGLTRSAPELRDRGELALMIPRRGWSRERIGKTEGSPLLSNEGM